MSDESVTIPLSEASPGMRLAKPIKNASGVTLMPAGIRLAPMFIVRLKKWQIEEVSVFLEANTEKAAPVRATETVADAPTKPDGTAGEFAHAIIDDVNARFTNVADNPLMVAIRDIAIRKLVSMGPGSYFNAMRVAVRESDGES